jgi:hypothetical protein
MDDDDDDVGRRRRHGRQDDGTAESTDRAYERALPVSGKYVHSCGRMCPSPVRSHGMRHPPGRTHSRLPASSVSMYGSAEFAVGILVLGIAGQHGGRRRHVFRWAAESPVGLVSWAAQRDARRVGLVWGL